MGNHDHYHGVTLTRSALDKNGIHELFNSGIWLTRGSDRFRIAGVDDFWLGVPRLKDALEGIKPEERCLLLSHNPDFAEKVDDPRVGLILSGHTHGGQVVFPLIGAPIVPSAYGQKYLRGLVQTEKNRVFISRGTGTITPPVRFACRPKLICSSSFNPPTPVYFLGPVGMLGFVIVLGIPAGPVASTTFPSLCRTLT